MSSAAPARAATPAPAQRLVKFIQYEEPGLQAGEYTITVTQETNQKSDSSFVAQRQFAVAGERFSIDPGEIAAVYPPDRAVGELSGVLPHVLFNRRTLPWERASVTAERAAPWLAVLLFDDGHEPTPQRRRAEELVPLGQKITVAGSSVTGEGALPAGIVSYPAINPLDYGEAPTDPVMTIDVDRAAFSAIAPAKADLPLLAHIRETDTVGVRDTAEESVSLAVVIGNRVPADGAVSHAFLVSLEHMESLLPDDEGNAAPALAGAENVRLITYRWWSFTAGTGGATFRALLEGVNAKPREQDEPLSSLQVPFSGAAPDPKQVERAQAAQAAGSISPAQASLLVHNAFQLGYLPLAHRLRHGGETVSWYRGPLAPLAVRAAVKTPVANPDEASRYDPQTGMFDVSYAAAWQLGRLLGLRSRAFATALCDWRRSLPAATAARAEQAALEERLGGAFESIVRRRASRLAEAPPEPPPLVRRWLARLALLHDVPFNYLVPDESMLPPESLRMFHLDRAWVDALLDGAFGIGRSTQGEHRLDAEHAETLRAAVAAELTAVRPNPERVDPDPEETEVTGFLLRSAAVAGWPDAAAEAYEDAERLNPLRRLRSARLGHDVWLCLFAGVADTVAIHEPPGQLHCGVEGTAGSLTTTLREVAPPTPGHQYDPPKGEEQVLTRADGRTLRAAVTAEGLEKALNERFDQKLEQFTSAEFALEMVKGVVEVEFRNGG
jgi:hypothetical protein